MEKYNLVDLIQRNIGINDLRIRNNSWAEDVYFYVRGKNDKGIWGHYSNGVPGGISYQAVKDKAWENIWELWGEPKFESSAAGFYVARVDLEIPMRTKDFDGNVGVPAGSVFFFEGRAVDLKLWRPISEICLTTKR